MGSFFSTFPFGRPIRLTLLPLRSLSARSSVIFFGSIFCHHVIFKILSALQGNSPNILNVLINAHALIGNHQNSKCKNLLYFSNTRNWTVIADMLVWFLKWRRHQTFGTRARDLLCLMLYPTLECVISTGWSSSGCFPCRKIQYYGTQLNEEHQKL